MVNGKWILQYKKVIEHKPCYQYYIELFVVTNIERFVVTICEKLGNNTYKKNI